MPATGWCRPGRPICRMQQAAARHNGSVSSPPPPTHPTGAPTDPPPVLETTDPPTTRTRALHDSMRKHESAARGSATALAWTVVVIVGCAVALVAFMLLRRN